MTKSRAVLIALLSVALGGMITATQAWSSPRGGDVTIHLGQTAVFHVHGEWVGCQYHAGEVFCSFPDGTPTMTTSTGAGRIRGMAIYLAAGESVNVKSVHVPANKTFTGNQPEDDTVWTFR